MHRLRGEEQLSAEIDALTAAARRGEVPQDKALEQIAKMFRNARESGANNRIHRSRRSIR